MGALASSITDAHPPLFTAFCGHLYIFTYRRYFQPSQSWSSQPPSSRVYSQLLSHSRLTNYMSHPFQSFIFTICNNIQIFANLLKFPICSYYPYCFFYHRSVIPLRYSSPMSSVFSRAFCLQRKNDFYDLNVSFKSRERPHVFYIRLRVFFRRGSRTNI
jgi:hypothetical protein